jgi:hypothetical protein
MTERARFRRDRRIHREERRLQAYADYSKALKVSMTVTRRMSAKLDNCKYPGPLPADQGEVLLGEALNDRESAWEYLRLVGHPSVISAATDWHERVWPLEGFVRAQKRDPAQWSKIWESVIILRERYYQAVRAELRIDDESGDSTFPSRCDAP